MELRAATLDDIEALLVLEQGVIEAERPFNAAIKAEGATYYDLHTLINEPHHNVIVAELEGRIIASGYVSIRDSRACFSHTRHGYLGFMYVNPDYRGQGINKRIMDNLLSWAKDQGVEAFYLDVYAENQAAIKAYEKLGFKSSKIEMQLI